MSIPPSMDLTAASKLKDQDMSSIFPVQSMSENHNIDKKQVEKTLALAPTNKTIYDPISCELKQWNFQELIKPVEQLQQVSSIFPMQSMVENHNIEKTLALASVNKTIYNPSSCELKQLNFIELVNSVKQLQHVSSIFPMQSMVENHNIDNKQVEKILALASADKTIYDPISCELKQWNMKPVEQLQLYKMPPPKVLMEFCSKESTLMDAPTSLCGESLNETESYKMAMLAGLVGTALIGASRASTRFPTARKIAVIAGIIINTIAVAYVIYNCKLNWKEEGKKQLNKVKALTSKILNVCKNFFKTQPSEEKQAVFNQRGDLAKI